MANDTAVNYGLFNTNTEQMSSFREAPYKLYSEFPNINFFIYLLNPYLVCICQALF